MKTELQKQNLKKYLRPFRWLWNLLFEGQLIRDVGPQQKPLEAYEFETRENAKMVGNWK